MAGGNMMLKLYLTAYNTAQALGWALVLARILISVVHTRSIEGAFDAAGELVRLLQLAAFMEVMHSILGIVPTGVLPTILQWGGRYHWIAAIVCKLKEVQRLPSVFITFAAWSLSEVIRYPQYALNALGLCPRWLTWLRYSAFIPLYPIGALCGEVLLLYQALPFIKKRNLYQNFFNKLPFNYYLFVVVVLALYPFLWLILYIYMLKQRRSRLRKRSSGKRKPRARSD